MNWWPDWLTYNTIKRALTDFAGPYADEIGLFIVITIALGLFVKLVVQPLRGK